jgi:hypothetical protein
MELSSIIPKKYKHLDKWKIKSNTLMFKNYQYIPVCFLSENNYIYIYFDIRVRKQIIELVKELIRSKYVFFFTIPDLSNPSGVLDYEKKVIKNYLLMYANSYFYIQFNKIGFDLIKNMVDWTVENNCCYLIKENFDIVLTDVSKKYYDYYSNAYIYQYPEDIRIDFNKLYREIQINLIL